jgi:spore coat polysaccharide biosynthesis protein SpsF (cytidylyltransferase family)
MVDSRKFETLIIIQARTSSKRLPEKVLKLVNGRPILEWQTLRVIETFGPQQVLMATSDEDADNRIEEVATNCGIPTIRGSLNNVFSRFITGIKLFNPKNVMRITGDCPLYMPELGQTMLEEFNKKGVDYLSNTLIPTYPDGCDIEIFRADSFSRLQGIELTEAELEHVTLGIYSRRHEFECENYINERDDSSHRWTLDTEDDLKFITNIYNNFVNRELSFNYDDVMSLLQKNPALARYDDGHMRNSGSKNVR